MGEKDTQLVMDAISFLDDISSFDTQDYDYEIKYYFEPEIEVINKTLNKYKQLIIDIRKAFDSHLDSPEDDEIVLDLIEKAFIKTIRKDN